MDGVFMKKNLKCVVLCACISVFMWAGGVLADRQKLNDQLIRLHVVANSDTQEDQQIKLQVRDAVVVSLTDAMSSLCDIDQARDYLRENLPKIEKTANDCLQSLGVDHRAVVSLQDELFDTRRYDTFTLPAGVYEALRITIGQGQGKNWWCVVFPTLCVPATTEGFADIAAGAGFSDALTRTLEGKRGYEIRFYLLDVLGNMQGYFVKG